MLMQSLVRSRLEAARKELLDLGLRNPLINYRPAASKGVAVVGEHAATVFRQLVVGEKSLSFAAARNGTGQAIVSDPSDTKLQTGEEEEKLQQRLLNTYYAARTTLEEQGVNTLFLALGMLHWYESDSSTEPRRAPLVLVPVALERSTAKERFRLRYTGEDLGVNLSLEAKLRSEWGIALPSIPDDENTDLDQYFAAVADVVSLCHRWDVAANEIALGFFSFGKFLLYNDLGLDQWPQDQQPHLHPLMTGILGEGFREGAPSIGEDAFLDHEPATGELLQAVDADATQLLAMLAVQEGRNLVIQGPPGTGKSQTITNIIANAIGQGKKVLFVAEKSAALEVVRRRLEALQLGDACLELHSHKANKKDLHAELRRTLELGKPALQHLQQQVALLDQHRDELNQYSVAVNTELQQSGLTAHDVAGRLLQIQQQSAGTTLPRLQLDHLAGWDALRMQRAEALAERIQAGLQPGIAPNQYLFWGSGLQVLLPAQQSQLIAAIDSALSAARALAQQSKALATSTGFPIPENREAVMALAAAMEMAAARPNLSGMHVAQEGWADAEPALTALVAAGEQLAALHQQFSESLLPEAWNADMLSIRAALLAHGSKWYRFLIGDYKQAVKQLAAYCTGKLPDSVAARLALAEAVLEARRLEQTLAAGAELATRYWGSAWKGNRSDWQQLAAATRYRCEAERSVQTGALPPAFIHYISRQLPAAEASAAHRTLLQHLSDHGLHLQALSTALAFNDGARFPGATLLHQPFGVQVQLLQQWQSQPQAIQEVIGFNNLVALAAEDNLLPLVHLAAHWPQAHAFLKMALQQTWYEHLLEVAINNHPPLRRFERTAHETVIEQFRQLDHRFLQYNRAKAALKHWEALPPADGGGQMSVLRNEFNRKARHMPIRKLMLEAGEAIQAIKPVFMMSPLSIANFLPPGALRFDLVVFDEASQVRPVEALGALLRGQQMVIVGDSKQLPPTSFFDNLGQEDAAEDSFTADLPSILGLCEAQGAPQRMLRWHYRSRHESLIRLSNQAFYDNRLVVFPAPGNRQGAGLTFYHLPHTAYDRGGTRTNRKEAEAVAEKVLEHARKQPHLSLGVVAFSTAQRDAIQNQLEQLRRQEPELEQFFRKHPQEPLFVKNLENVQGDERDVIFISIGYGRTAEGYVSQSFGPINNEGGEKRLNVLITRARIRCAVFTNLTADDIDAAKSGSIGLRVLKSFLQYAQKGILDVPQASGRPPGSPFEAAVEQRLVALGYQVHRQVGATGFFIDLAVVDPEQPGRYVLGIECDGASYHSARTARDRDRLRQQVLEAMGWRIYRIWSTDWFRNPEKELERLVAAIDIAWKATLDAGDEGDEPVADTALLREAPKPGTAKLQAYQLVQLPAEIGQAEMHQHPVGKVAKWVELVVRVEGPIHFDELARRMVEAAGITRVGPRIRDHLKLATRFAEGSGAIRQNGDFLYHNGGAQPPMRDRSELPAASRKWKYVAPEEVAAVLYKVVKEAIGIEPEEAYPLVVRQLGFARVTEEMRQDILGLVPAMEAAGLLRQEGGVLKIGS